MQGIDRTEPSKDRTEFLTDAFSNRRDFFYRGRKYTYIPGPKGTITKEEIPGYIGKPVEEFVNDGPEKLFALTRKEHWKASFIVIDVRKDRQIVAFEKRADVGSANGIITALFEDVISQSKTTSWHVDVEYISVVSDFWKAAEELKGKITELVFKFYPPNGLKGFETFKEFDRIAKKQAVDS